MTVSMRIVKWNLYSKDRGGDEEPPTTQVHLKGQSVAGHDLRQQKFLYI